MHFWRGGRTIPTTAASGDPVTSWKISPGFSKGVKDQGNIRVFPKIGGKPPKWMVKIMDNPTIKMDDLGVPLFPETSIPSRERIHIPPWKKENHLQNWLFQGICDRSQERIPMEKNSPETTNQQNLGFRRCVSLFFRFHVSFLGEYMEKSLEGICEVFGNVDAISGIWKFCHRNEAVNEHWRCGPLTNQIWKIGLQEHVFYHWNPGVELKLQIQSACNLEILQSLSSYSYDLCLSSTAFPSFHPFTTHHRLTLWQSKSSQELLFTPILWFKPPKIPGENGWFKHLEQRFYQLHGTFKKKRVLKILNSNLPSN